MMTVLNCVYHQHNPWLVLAAAVVCIVSSWGVIRLHGRARDREGLQRVVWNFLTAILAGSAIWSTHFIALLGFDAGVPVEVDPALTVLSLLVAMVGTSVGFWVTTLGSQRLSPALGGAIVGLAIVAMHYSGMIAYRAKGIISWDWPYVYASILLSVTISAWALHVASRKAGKHAITFASALLVLAIVLLHFTGMTAFRVEPLMIDASDSNPVALQALGFAVAGVAFLIGCAGLASYLIDDGVRADSYRELQKMAMSDGLTGLANRRGFQERLEQEIQIANATGSSFALVGIDLDRFKEINDLRGHAAGDAVLRVLSHRMAATLSSSEFAGRVGGDEFAAIHRMESQASLMDFVGRLEAILNAPIDFDEYHVLPGASIGVAIYPDNAADKATLINNADLAMYRAKADVSRTVCFYQSSMDETVRQRRSLANDLREALERDELTIHYQVQTVISSGEIIGYEALLRWEHPVRGFIPPTEFIGIAEENGLILQLGEWVLRTACMKAATWEPPYKISVNISAVQFAYTNLPDVIAAILKESGLVPERLELELTETTIFADKDRALRILRQIKDLGVNVALDDFGTGYSSLDTLRSFPFDKIKLDRSFIIELESSPQAKAIIRAVLALGRSLSIPVLAEGIETEGQLALLKKEGCDEAQGYLLGRPAALEHILASGQIAIVDRSARASLVPASSAEKIAAGRVESKQLADAGSLAERGWSIRRR